MIKKLRINGLILAMLSFFEKIVQLHNFKKEKRVHVLNPSKFYLYSLW